MSENAFWVWVWAIAAATLLGIMSLVTYNLHDAKQSVVDMVKAGADPLAASCAINPEFAAVCMGTKTKP